MASRGGPAPGDPEASLGPRSLVPQRKEERDLLGGVDARGLHSVKQLNPKA